MPSLRRFAFTTAALAVASTLPACYVETYPGSPATVTSADVDADGYSPAYYDGYLVYYDTVGHPYYYDRGAVVWIAPSSPHYVGLVNHWHAYGRTYPAWYARSGHRYRAYRAAPGYHAYRGYRRR